MKSQDAVSRRIKTLETDVLASKALALRLRGVKVVDIAKHFNRHTETILEWFKRPKIIAELIEISRSPVAYAQHTLKDAVIAAADTVIDISQTGKAEANRLNAALYILKMFGLQPPKVSIMFEKKQITIMREVIGMKKGEKVSIGGRSKTPDVVPPT